MTTSDMLTHPWILSETQSSYQLPSKFKLTLKDLLNVSSDWKDVNKKQAGGGAYSTGGGSSYQTAGGLPMDFQS